MKWPLGIHSKWNRKGWLLPYIFSGPFKRKEVRTDHSHTHVLFLFVDHFEPGHGGVDLAGQRERVEQWRQRYPEIVRPFQDCEGNRPRHTWFYLGEDPEHLKLLSELCFQGLGEVELHIHHGPQDRIPDHWKHQTREGLARHIETQKDLFARFGALITAEPRPRKCFGFIHGMFALDNSLPEFCGLPGELELLRTLGCYADFTLPAPGKSQPSLINRLYYPTGNPKKGCSYFNGEEIRVGGSFRDKVLLFQGPLGLIQKGLGFHVEEGQLEADYPPTPERIQYWLSRKIQVLDRPDWIFVKVHTHGAMEKNIQQFLGEPMERLHRQLAEACGTSSPYRFHYVSAREAFNIAMAAMSGAEGDPGQFRNFLIPPYANTCIHCNRSYHLEGYSCGDWSLKILDPEEVTLKVKGTPETEIKADYMEGVHLSSEEGKISLQAKGKGTLTGQLMGRPVELSCNPSSGQEGEFRIINQNRDSTLTFSGRFSEKGIFKVTLR